MEAKIIAPKMHDSCRKQLCLTHKELGSSRTSACCGTESTVGGIVRPPQAATSVTADNLRVKKIYMQKKSLNPFKAGYWDITVGFAFEYLLTFWDMCGCKLSTVEAGNSYSMKITMRGTENSCEYEEGMVIASDLPFFGSGLISTDVPIFHAAANAALLDVEIYRNPYKDCADDVHITIGFFGVIHLLRYAYLNILKARNAAEIPITDCF